MWSSKQKTNAVQAGTATLLLLIAAQTLATRSVVHAGAETAEQRTVTVTIQNARTTEPVPAVIRVLNSDNMPLKLEGLFKRPNGWYSIASGTAIKLPKQKLTIQALRGIESLRTAVTVHPEQTEVTLDIERFADLKHAGWQSGNTHLHLNKLSRRRAEEYLRLVPDSDDLSLVYLSHLRRIPDESTYISNSIVEDEWDTNALQQLSSGRVLLRPGEEHRHNFGGGGEGFGHVMLLEIPQLIRPVSIGPGIMRSGSDSQPLQRGIRRAIDTGGTVIWCHNTFGFEDVPNWLNGTLHAQNIFDGGSRGSYSESFYRYLNLGLRVPFSTGTDWFIDDFSRVYIPGAGKINSRKWLTGLRNGKSTITNGPLLSFSVNGKRSGHIFDFDGPVEVHVRADANGRDDFGSLQLIWNGRVYVTAEAQRGQQKVFSATLEETLQVAEPGWLAVRTQPQSGTNDFNRALFAHTSPIYLDLQGRQTFHPDTAIQLIAEMEESLQTIREKAVFATSDEDIAVKQVYLEGISQLRQMLRNRSR